MKKLRLKVKFNTAIERFEKYSHDAYILHLPFEKDGDSLKVVKHFLSRHFGLPVQNITYMGLDHLNNLLFVLE